MLHSDPHLPSEPNLHEVLLADPNNTISDAIDIKLTELNNLARNQKVIMEGYLTYLANDYLTLDDDPPKEVVKCNREKGPAKEDCVIEDIDGLSTIYT